MSQKYPQAIRELMKWPQGVCWQPDIDERTGKIKKPPFDPKTGRAARVNDPTTWASFAQAGKGYHKYGFNDRYCVKSQEVVAILGWKGVRFLSTPKAIC